MLFYLSGVFANKIALYMLNRSYKSLFPVFESAFAKIASFKLFIPFL